MPVRCCANSYLGRNIVIISRAVTEGPPASARFFERHRRGTQYMMKFTKTASVEDLQVIARFEKPPKNPDVGRIRRSPQKPLAYWALPTDRRLPLAFLGRTLEELLRAPFSELSNTPGVSKKKMCSFVKLLGRAANTDPSELPADATIYPKDQWQRKRQHPGRKRLRSRDGFRSRLGPVTHQRGQTSVGRRSVLCRVCRT